MRWKQETLLYNLLISQGPRWLYPKFDLTLEFFLWRIEAVTSWLAMSRVLPCGRGWMVRGVSSQCIFPSKTGKNISISILATRPEQKRGVYYHRSFKMCLNRFPMVSAEMGLWSNSLLRSVATKDPQGRFSTLRCHTHCVRPVPWQNQLRKARFFSKMKWFLPNPLTIFVFNIGRLTRLGGWITFPYLIPKALRLVSKNILQMTLRVSQFSLKSNHSLSKALRSPGWLLSTMAVLCILQLGLRMFCVPLWEIWQLLLGGVFNYFRIQMVPFLRKGFHLSSFQLGFSTTT